MTTAFTNSSANTKFKRHYPHEVIRSEADAKQKAIDLNNAYRYQYKAKVTVVGDNTIRPYDPIYLDGLPNGMSGYWTVLSVTHSFGQAPGYYVLHLVVGTDTPGDINPSAGTASATRDIQNELAGKSIALTDCVLVDYSVSPNNSKVPNAPIPGANPNVNPPVSMPPASLTNSILDPYAAYPPSETNPRRTVKWVSTNSGRTI